MPVITAPKIHVQNLEEESIKKERSKYSEFEITINTNKRYKIGDPNLQNDVKFFKDCINNMLLQPEEFLKLDGDYEEIETINSDVGIEIGPKSRCLHAHIIIYTKHNLKDVKIDAYEIKEYLKKMLGLVNLNVYFKARKSNLYGEDYIKYIKLI